MNKTVYQCLAVTKIVMYECSYDYIKRKCGKKNHKCCYMDTDSSIVQVITKDIYVDIAKNVEIWFYNSI